MSRIVSTELPAFVLLQLGMKDGAAERAVLAGAGVRHYVKGNQLFGDRDNVYVIEQEALTEDLKEALATLLVPMVLHVCTGRKVTPGFKSEDYNGNTGFDVMGTWAPAPKDSDEGFHIKGRNFRIAQAA